jgi:hypothetical protein
MHEHITISHSAQIHSRIINNLKIYKNATSNGLPNHILVQADTQREDYQAVAPLLNQNLGKKTLIL